ncbi:hypothetical protein Tco_0596428 [Tanacetum coccineum]
MDPVMQCTTLPSHSECLKVRLLAAASSFFESRYFLSPSSYFLAMSKNDMKDRICALSKNDLKDLVKTYCIPLDLHPRLPDPGFTMDRLPVDAIDIYYEFLRDEVVVCSGLSYVWFNQECDPIFRRVDDNVEMSIYDFMTLPSWSDAKIAEESHHLSLPLLERAPTHTTASTMEGAIILLPTPDEIVASLPYSRLVKKSKGPSHANRPSKKRKLHKRDLEAGSSAPELDQAKGTDETGLADLYAEIEDSLKIDEGVSTRAVSAPTLRLGKRLGAPPSIAVVSASKPSHVGTSAPASTSGRSLSLGDICRKALDRTITPSELRRTESLLPLELSNRVNVLSALLVSHGYELNSCYANLVSSKAHLQEKFDQNKGDVKLLRSEVTSLDSKLENLQRAYDALGQENRELRS